MTHLGSDGANAVKAFNAGIDVILDLRDTMERFRGAQGGSGIGADSAGATGSVGATDTDRESTTRAASHARGEPRKIARDRRLSSSRGGGAVRSATARSR